MNTRVVPLRPSSPRAKASTRLTGINSIFYRDFVLEINYVSDKATLSGRRRNNGKKVAYN